MEKLLILELRQGCNIYVLNELRDIKITHISSGGLSLFDKADLDEENEDDELDWDYEIEGNTIKFSSVFMSILEFEDGPETVKIFYEKIKLNQ